MSRHLPSRPEPHRIGERDTRPSAACPATDAELADDRDTAVGRRFGIRSVTIHGDRCGSTLQLGGAR